MTRFGAVWYRIFTCCSVRVSYLAEKCLATGAVRYDIRRTRTMLGLGNLSMAGLFAAVLPTVEGSTARIRTGKCTNPFLHGHGTISCSVSLSALLFVGFVPAQDVFLYLTTVTPRRDTYFARTTGTIMARA